MSQVGQIALLPTIIVNAERGAAAGIVVATLYYSNGQAGIGEAIGVWLTWFIAGPLLALMFHGIGRAMGLFGEIGQAVGGFTMLMGFLLVAAGDPLLWLVKKIDPALIPIEDFYVFNRAAVLIAYQASPA